MKKDNFFRKINRGIALTFLSLVALILYLIIQDIRFEEEKISIEQTLQHYIKAVEIQQNDLQQQYSTQQAPVQSLTWEQLSKNLESLSPYATNDLLLASRSYIGKTQYHLNDTMNIMNSIVEQNQKSGFQLDQIQLNLTDVKKINRFGSNLATAHINIDMMVKTTGSASFFDGFQTQNVSGSTGDDFSAKQDLMPSSLIGKQDLTTPMKKMQYSLSYEYGTVFLKKIDGAWKVISSDPNQQSKLDEHSTEVK